MKKKDTCYKSRCQDRHFLQASQHAAIGRIHKTVKHQPGRNNIYASVNQQGQSSRRGYLFCCKHIESGKVC